MFVKTVATEAVINRRHVDAATELSVAGQRGRFMFRRLEVDESGAASVTCWGGPAGREMWRTFPLERVARVHRVAKRRPQA